MSRRGCSCCAVIEPCYEILNISTTLNPSSVSDTQIRSLLGLGEIYFSNISLSATTTENTWITVCKSWLVKGCTWSSDYDDGNISDTRYLSLWVYAEAAIAYSSPSYSGNLTGYIEFSSHAGAADYTDDIANETDPTNWDIGVFRVGTAIDSYTGQSTPQPLSANFIPTPYAANRTWMNTYSVSAS